MSAHGSRSLRLLHGASARGMLRSPHLLKKVEAGFPPATFRNRLVVDADPSGLGLNTLFAVSAGAKFVHTVCPSRVAAAACEQLIAANGVGKYARPCSLDVAGGIPPVGSDRILDDLRSNATAMKPPLVTASLADLVELHPIAVAHYVRTLQAVRRHAPNAEAHASLTLAATVAHLPGHYRQCARVLGIDLDAASTADGEDGVTIGHAALDKTLDGLNGGLVDFAATGRILHELGIPAQAWRIPVTKSDLGFIHGSPSSAVVLPPAPHEQHQQRTAHMNKHQVPGSITLCRIPLRFSESVTGSAPSDAAPVIQGRAIVVWASAFAGRGGRGATPPLTSEPEASAEASRRGGSTPVGRSRREWEDREEFEALRAAAPEDLVTADAPPVVLFVPDAVARRLVRKWHAAPSAQPRRTRNTVKGRRRAEQEAAATPQTSDAGGNATWELELQLRVSCRADGDADSLLFELVGPPSRQLSHHGSEGATPTPTAAGATTMTGDHTDGGEVLHAWS